MDPEILNLPPEIEEGNIEYKRKIDISEKITKFKIQMLWRMSEGKKKGGVEEAIYYIGIDDDGSISGQTIEEINISIVNFSQIIKQHHIEIYSTQIEYTPKGVIAILRVRKFEDHILENELKIALLGSSGHGKTTFIGVMTYDMLDNGEGSARSSIFRHSHESLNGVTSSIKYDIMGYSNEKYINYNSGFISSWEHIVKNSRKIINFIDLPGNFKYIKTIIFGLLAHRPDYVFLLIGLSNIYENTLIIEDDIKLHLALCHKFNIPFGIILTKCDKVHSCKIPEIMTCLKSLIHKPLFLYHKESEDNFIDTKVPVLTISNVTGENINMVHHLLQKIPTKSAIHNDTTIEDVTEFMINDVLYGPDIGIVVSGIVNNGRIKVDDKLLVGPINKTFYNAYIVSIHKKQIPSKYLYQNEIGSIVIRIDKDLEITKHMMLISQNQIINFINQFNIIVPKEEISDFKKDAYHMIFCKNIYDCIIINQIIELENEETLINVSFHNKNIQLIKDNDFIAIRHNNLIVVGKTRKT
jgi:elongation factor 1-alpha